MGNKRQKGKKREKKGKTEKEKKEKGGKGEKRQRQESNEQETGRLSYRALQGVGGGAYADLVAPILVVARTRHAFLGSRSPVHVLRFGGDGHGIKDEVLVRGW